MATDSGFVLTPAEQEYLASAWKNPVRLTYSYDMFYSLTQEGPVGMLVPLITFMQDKLGLEVQVEKAGWNDAFAHLKNGTTDFYGLVTTDKDRMQDYDSINPLFRAAPLIVTRKNAPLGSLLELRNKKIGLLEGSIIRKAVSTYLYPDGSIAYYPSGEALFDALEKGEVDCVGVVDLAAVDVLRRPNLRFEFTIQNLVLEQGLVSTRAEMKPLIAIINRYLETPQGIQLLLAVEAARKAEIFRSAHLRLAGDIAALKQQCNVIRMYDNSVLYPMSYVEDGQHKGLQADINRIFEKLSGLDVQQNLTDYPEGFRSALNALHRDACQAAAGIYANRALREEEALDYSDPVWVDNIRIYTYGESNSNLRDVTLGTTVIGTNYINWEFISGTPPHIYTSRRELMTALKNNEVDAAFISDMAFNYYYTVLQDYDLRELGETTAVANLYMMFSAKNTPLKNLFNEAISLHQVLYPYGRVKWQEQAERYKTDHIRIRNAQHTIFYGIAGVFLLMGFLVLYSRHRYVRYDRQISQLIRQQQTFDLAWGNMKTRRFISKGDHPFFRQWGLQFQGASTTIDDLSNAFGWDLYADYAKNMADMARDKVTFVIADKTVVSPLDGKNRYYRRYMHRLNNHEFMSCLQDITDEMTKVETLTHVASTDFLSTLLTRRAMNDRLIAKSRELQQTGETAWLVMLDIDNFKNINDSYGHDVGDDVLRAISSIIQETEGFEEATSRWGGEEFLALVKCDSMEEVKGRVQSIISRVAAHPMPILNTERTFNVTISAGLTKLVPEKDYADSLHNADEALYEAKRSGKNCVCIQLGG